VCRNHLQAIPSSSADVYPALNWSSGKTLEFLSGIGVCVVKRDKLAHINVPQDTLEAPPCPPKRRKLEEEKDFVAVCGQHLSRGAESGASLDNLPDELLLAIFAYLPLKDLLKVSLICKRWHRLSFDESLWQSLDLAGGNLLPGVIGQLLPAGVTVFRCPRACIWNPLFKTTKLLRLQHLDLSYSTVCAADLQRILCLCERLQNLSLEALGLSDDIMENITRNHNLMRLNLSGCKGFSAEAMAVMLSSCSMLQELNLSWCDFTATHVKAAVCHIPSNISQLNLSGYRENLEIADVKTLVERCRFLVRLDL
ncbi:SKP2 protein, partial [Pitta sordida]|nr:SKP2 protein [Pitta sordida]